MPEYKKIKNFQKLSETTVDVLHPMNEYGKKNRLRNEIVVHLVDDQLHVIEKDTYGMYQINFYVNVLNPLENSSILNKQT